LSGFTWYQGEANTEDNSSSAHNYAHLFPEMIQQWREGFNASDAYFGFVQLSTWCPPQPHKVAEMRQAQMAALQLKSGKVGYATNADHGFGCNIHPPAKQYCGARLGRSALALQYGQDIHWKSPSYKQYVPSNSRSSSVLPRHNAIGSMLPFVVIEMQDVSDKGLYILDSPYNGRLDPKDFQCANQVPGTCAGAQVLLNGKSWVNATLSLKGKRQVVLTAEEGDASSDVIVATSYGWGSVPMLSIYDAGTDLPVLPWRGSLSGVAI
jgi:sialate O-acetylesterase